MAGWGLWGPEGFPSTRAVTQRPWVSSFRSVRHETQPQFRRWQWREESHPNNDSANVYLTAASLGSWTSFLPSRRSARRRREGNCLKGWRRGCCCLPGRRGGSWDDPPAPGRNDIPSHDSAQSPRGWNRGKKISPSEGTVELIAKSENLFCEIIQYLITILPASLKN